MSFLKKILSKIGLMPKAPKLNPGKTDIQLPFSRSSDKKNHQERIQSDNVAKKTMVGIQPDKPPGDHPTRSSNGEPLSCPECQYPLRVAPSKSSPCPNCGFSGIANNIGDTVFDLGKTMAVSSLDVPNDPGIEEFKFKLIEETSNSEIKIQSEEPEVILNRSHLDPSNMSISGEQHILIRFKQNKIYVEDVSSNGSTFLQVKNVQLVQPGTRLVLGNKICLFNTLEQPSNKTDADKATRKFGGFDLNSQEGTTGFVLTDEKSGKKIAFNEQHVIVNRSNLDTGNNTISSSRHAEFHFDNGCWYIRDLSSTGATFIQVRSEQLLDNKLKLIIGNKVFRFEYDFS
jgi:hypothetical protein